jgi:hypothetical protein
MPSNELAGYGPAEPLEGAHPLGGYGPAEDAAGATPLETTASGLPRQTGKRFIEPPEDDHPSLQDEQVAALGVAPTKRVPTGEAAKLQEYRDYLASRPGVGERFARNISQGVPVVGPFTDEMAAALQAPFSNRSYQEIRDENRARNRMALEDAPIESTITRTAAGLAPVGALFKGANTAGEVAKRAFGIGAAEGAGASEHDLTKGDVGGVARDAMFSGALNAALAGGTSKLVRGAPERVDEKMLENVARGEGGKAPRKLTDKLNAKAGDSEEPVGVLNEVLSRFPGLKKVLVTSAASSPRKAAEAVEDRISIVNARLKPIYQQIDNAGGTKLIDLVSSTDKLRRDLLAEGRAGMAEAVDRFRESLVKSFGTDGKVPDTTKLTGTALRNLRNEIGQIAFKSVEDANTPVGIQAKRRIYGAMNDAIEKAGAAAGVDVARLRQLNKDDSMLLSVLEPLKTRGLNAASGGNTLKETIMHSIAPVAAAAAGFGHGHGGVTGAAEAVALAAGALAARRVLGPAVRATDYQLAKLVEAARAGSTPAQIAQLGLELGLSRTIAPVVADKLARTILPPDEAETQ